MTTQGPISRSILHYNSILTDSDGPFIIFDQPSSEQENATMLLMPRSRWEDNGKPDTITISIEVGDTLND